MKNQTKSSDLQYKVFTVTRQGLTQDPQMPATPDQLKWAANSATFIYGDQDAALIDCFLTIDQSQQLIDFIVTFGKNLKYIYITHPHGDHFFGLKLLLDHFPEAKAITSANAGEAMLAHIEPDAVNAFWRRRFPDQIPEELIVPNAFEDSYFELEGHPLQIIEDGFTDTHHSTSIYVPSIGLVVAGDVVYNGIHPYLAETTKQTRQEWMAALDKLESLHPKAVIAGHKNPDYPDSPANIAATKKYLEDFEQLNSETSSASGYSIKCLLFIRCVLTVRCGVQLQSQAIGFNSKYCWWQFEILTLM
jgi:glyoxylase-like metal-dependent hydrolase (beta-lactamase superfamily II)